MTIAEFKSAKGIDSLAFHNSKHSNRKVAVDAENTFMLVTTAEFDPAQPAYVYKAEQQEGDLVLYWVSNKAKSEAAFSL